MVRHLKDTDGDSSIQVQLGQLDHSMQARDTPV